MRQAIERTMITILLAGCAPAVDHTAEEAEPPLDTAVAVEDAAVTHRIPVWIEGMLDTLDVRVHEAPVDFPLGYRTYVPVDMVIEYTTSAEGEAVRFEAAFGEVRRPEAYLKLTALDPDLSSERARESVAIVADTLGYSPRPQRYPWSAEEFVPAGPESGFLALGEKNGNWFYFLSQYPAEYGDGMAPRVALILSHWTWLTTGAGLEPPPLTADP